MRHIQTSPQFQKSVKSFLTKHHELESNLVKLMQGLKKDIFNPKYRTHKLNGSLKMLYSANINYQYRLVFYFDEETIFLVNIGDHDEVY